MAGAGRRSRTRERSRGAGRTCSTSSGFGGRNLVPYLEVTTVCSSVQRVRALFARFLLVNAEFELPERVLIGAAGPVPAELAGLCRTVGESRQRLVRDAGLHPHEL